MILSLLPYKKSCRRQGGDAAIGIVALMLGFAVLWWVFMKITGCIYEVKEERAQQMAEVLGRRKSVKEQEPEREPGGYAAKCIGMDGSCKIINTTPTPYPPTPTPRSHKISSVGKEIEKKRDAPHR